MQWKILYLDQRDVKALGAEDMKHALVDVEAAMSGERRTHCIRLKASWSGIRTAMARPTVSIPCRAF